MIRLLLLSACVTALVGCAAAPTATVASSDDATDTARVAAIERAAMAQGVKVIWVNKPQRRTVGG
jgi:hypothetical protein